MCIDTSDSQAQPYHAPAVSVTCLFFCARLDPDVRRDKLRVRSKWGPCRIRSRLHVGSAWRRSDAIQQESGSAHPIFPARVGQSERGTRDGAPSSAAVQGELLLRRTQTDCFPAVRILDYPPLSCGDRLHACSLSIIITLKGSRPHAVCCPPAPDHAHDIHGDGHGAHESLEGVAGRGRCGAKPGETVSGGTNAPRRSFR
jgi:hypothetical protein